MPRFTTHVLACAAACASVAALTPAALAATPHARARAVGSGGAALARAQVTHPPTHTMREGMSGAAVRVLQRRLTAAGYRTAVDGSFGPLTRDQVRRFQRAHGLRATGVVTPAQLAMLAGDAVTASTDDPTQQATIDADGTLSLPAGAPLAVQEIVAAANQIIDTPYEWGGGHGGFSSPGYDCSGAVSFALHGAGLLAGPEDSTGLESLGAPGRGRWVTVYANAGHTFLVVAGRAFDTADFGGPDIPAGSGPRWRSDPTGNLADGTRYVVRHPVGL